MKRLKLIYIISDIDKAISFEWLAIRLNEKFDLRFILIGKKETALKIWLSRNNIDVHEISNDDGRLSQWRKLFWILFSEKPDIVHTHLWIANLLGLSSAWLLGVKRRVFTRHHATIHYDEHPSGRKWDKWCNYSATHIVAISKNIQSILIDWDKANPNKVKLIPHGFDLDYFANVADARVNKLKEKYNIMKHQGPVIGVIARYMKWKGVQLVVEAFKAVLQVHPSALLILANAHGNYSQQIKKQLTSVHKSSYVEIVFEEDLSALYRLFDIYVHVPIDSRSEAFGQTYIEALASGIPSVFTLSGIAPEFIEHQKNAWVVNFNDSRAIAEGILKIQNDAGLRQRLKTKGFDAVKRFAIDSHIRALEELYTHE